MHSNPSELNVIIITTIAHCHAAGVDVFDCAVFIIVIPVKITLCDGRQISISRAPTTIELNSCDGFAILCIDGNTVVFPYINA